MIILEEYAAPSREIYFYVENAAWDRFCYQIPNGYMGSILVHTHTHIYICFYYTGYPQKNIHQLHHTNAQVFFTPSKYNLTVPPTVPSIFFVSLAP